MSDPHVIEAGQIIGLKPGPWDLSESDAYPRYGYDGYLTEFEGGAFHDTGFSREEWIALANVMIRRWTQFRDALRDAPAPPTTEPR